MILYEAPSREDNYAEAREFAYLAEVDILGWKFRKMADGGLVIDTPKVTSGMGGHNMVAVLSPGHLALLLALASLETPQEPEVPDSWKNVGKAVQP